MRLTVVVSSTNEMRQVELPDSATLGDLKQKLVSETGISIQNQEINYNYKILSDDSAQLTVFGVRNDDLIYLDKPGTPGFGIPEQSPPQNPFPVSAPGSQALTNPLLNLGGGGVPSVSGQRQRFLDSARVFISEMTAFPDDLHHLFFKNRELAEAVVNNDVEYVANFYEKLNKEKLEKRLKEEERIAELEADPLNPDAQKEIEKIITERRVNENWEYAHENFPESFGHITMLYIECSINGHSIQAFVDSGCQTTTISKACAEKCGILKLLDIRSAQMVIGVGHQKSLGRIHAAPLEVAGNFYECNFTVLDNSGIDLLFGLDNLKRHQCSIDLAENRLFMRKSEVSVPFLSEAEIIKNPFEGVIPEDQQKMLEENKEQK